MATGGVGLLVATIGVASGRIQQPTPLPTPAWMNASGGVDLLAEPRSDETVVAETVFGPIALEKLTEYYGVAQVPVEPVVNPDQVARMPLGWVDNVARHYAVAKIAEREVDRMPDGPEKRKLLDDLKKYQLNYVLDALMKKEIQDKIAEPTADDIAAYYENHKPEYWRPFQFYMRQLVKLTYERYTVKEADTLESIALRVAGDPAKIREIRRDVDGAPPVLPQAGGIPRELKIGENLLVPMNAEKKAQVRRSLETILERVETTDLTFEKAAQDFSDAPDKGAVFGPLPQDRAKEMLDEIVEAARETAIGELSEVFETKHGFHVIEIVNKSEEGHQPIERVAPRIKEILTEAQKQKLDAELSLMLFGRPELEVDYEKIRRGEALPDDEVVIRVGEEAFTWKDFRSTWERTGRPTEDREAAFWSVRSFGGAQLALAWNWARDNKILEEGPWAGPAIATRATLLSWAYRTERVKQLSRERVTDRAIEEYYNKSKRQLTTPPVVSYVGYERPQGVGFDSLTERQKRDELARIVKEVERELKDVNTIDRFQEFIQLKAPPGGYPQSPAIVASPVSGRQVNMDLLTGETGAQVKKARVGRPSEPFVEEGKVVRAVFVTEKFPARILALDEVRRQIVDHLTQQFAVDINVELQTQWLRDSQYKLVLEK